MRDDGYVKGDVMNCPSVSISYFGVNFRRFIYIFFLREKLVICKVM